MPDFPDDSDGEVLRSLASHGIDLSLPRLIEFPVATPDEESANEVLRAVTAAGYEAYIDCDETEEPDGEVAESIEDDFEPEWTVYATRQMIPEYDALVRIQAELEALATPWGGYSAGWGVTVEDPGDE